MIHPSARKTTSALLVALVVLAFSAPAPAAHAMNGAVVEVASGLLASLQAAFSGVFDFFSADVDPNGGGDPGDPGDTGDDNTGT